MMQLSNMQSQNLWKIFKQLHLPENMAEQLEDYINGLAGKEVFSQLVFQDLRRFYHSPSAALFLTFVNKGMFTQAKRYFEILFAIGGPSCKEMLPEDIWGLNQRKKIEIDQDKILAVFAYEEWENKESQWVLESVKSAIEGNFEVVQKALSYKDGQKEKGRMFLFTLYFLLKYPNVKPRKQKEEGDFLDEINRLFDKKGSTEVVLEEADLEFMKEYEDCACRQINYMLNQGLLSSEIARITELLHQEELSNEAKNLVKRHTVIFEVVRKITGLAFVNFGLSGCLKNVVSLACCINRNAALEGMHAADIRQDLRLRGGNFDEVFGIDTKKFILWAAQEYYKDILQLQFKKNRELYISCCEIADDCLMSRMLSIVKELDLPLFQKRRKQEQEKVQEKLIRDICSRFPTVSVQIRDYIEGNVPIDSLYVIEDQLKGYHNRNWWDDYAINFGEDEFYRRGVAFMVLEQNIDFFTQKVISLGAKSAAEKIFRILDLEKMDLHHQIRLAFCIWDYFYIKSIKQAFMDTTKAVFARYLLERREETLEAFCKVNAFGRYFALCVLEEKVQENKSEILAYLHDNSKLVKEKLLGILYQQTDWEEEIKEALMAKKASIREIAVRVLAHWDKEKYQAEFEQMFRKEKNVKILDLLAKILQLELTKEDRKGESTLEELVKELHKGGKSRSLAWAYQTPFSVVHKKNGEEASKEYLQAIFLCYSGMQPFGINVNAASLAQELCTAEFEVYVNELFDKWIEMGAEAKKRWVLFAASIHGGIEIIKKLQHQIQEWPQCARGAIASDAVWALALNPDPQALLIVDGIARKFKFKQVKAAAGKALDFAAEQLGLKREELEDRIVPNLGFDEHMERIFDYGTRRFTVMITAALEIEVLDENGKKLKNLPAPGKKDDDKTAALAYEEFKRMKKQMKTTISSQKARLELALSSERLWSVTAWQELFVKNPLMHQFAIGLIWGIYQDKKLVQSFRYMEDGTFNTEEEEEFLLPKEGKIGLVHPIEFSKEVKDAWKEQLEDYEIVQPIAQLNREIFYLTEEEKTLSSLERFGGYVVNDMSLGGKLLALGWYRGSILDGGGFYTFYREDANVGLGVELHFSGSGVGYGGVGDVTIYDARFYPAGTIDRGNYSYDEVRLENAIVLSEVPKRYFSEIVRQLAFVTASSSQRNENWKKRGW